MSREYKSHVATWASSDTAVEFIGGSDSPYPVRCDGPMVQRVHHAIKRRIDDVNPKPRNNRQYLERLTAIARTVRYRVVLQSDHVVAFAAKRVSQDTGVDADDLFSDSRIKV